MYLNVNLTPPPAAAGEGSCTTPKTPEILNSLINLTSPPLPYSYSQYQTQVETGTLLSPTSDLSSPDEPTTSLNTCDLTSPLNHMGAGLPCGFPSGGSGGLMGGSGVGGPLTGASPPSTPDLPSPVNTVEATKSALIKEGLKHQIRSKLQAAGIDSPESILDETKRIKDEVLGLTEEDEERRRRRRERNKIAATKCRNKKKEKTYILMSESESVEDVNLRLKNEIQRLTSEKMKLEKLLDDPNHLASCRHTPRCTTKTPRPPLLIVTPAESPDATSSSSSSASSTSSESPTSPPHSYMSPPSSSQQPLPPVSTISQSSPISSSSSSSSSYLAPKYCPQNSRYHPYQFPGRQQEKTYPVSSPQTKQTYNYSGVGRTNEFISPAPPTQKSIAKRNTGLARYNPYSGRPTPITSPLATHTHPQSGSCTENYIQNNNGGCGREDQQSYVTDVHTNQFFPPCSYHSM